MFCITLFCHSWEKLPILPSLYLSKITFKILVNILWDPTLHQVLEQSCTQLLFSYCLKFFMMSLPETPSGATISANPGWYMRTAHIEMQRLWKFWYSNKTLVIKRRTFSKLERLTQNVSRDIHLVVSSTFWKGEPPHSLKVAYKNHKYCYKC